MRENKRMHGFILYAVAAVFIVGAGVLIYCGAVLLDGKRPWRIPHRPKSRFDLPPAKQ